MGPEENPIKQFLFEYINDSSGKFSRLISQQRFADVVEDIVVHCYDRAAQTAGKEESLGVLATGILHYIMTCALVPSQRRVKVCGTEIDIVVPNLKTLQADPKKALIVCIPKTLDRKTIETRLEQLQKIQPEKQNIWLVLSKNLEFDNRTYLVSKINPTVSKIVYDVAQFVNVQGQDKLKILRV